MRRRKLAPTAWILAAAAATLTTAAGCGQPVATFTVDPGSAMPAEPIVLKGLTIPAAQRDGIAITLGKTVMFFNYRKDGAVVGVVPAYMDGSSWPVVPTKPQTVKVYRKGTLIAQSAKPLTVLPLKKAPGTTRQLAKNLDAIAASFDALNTDFPPANEEVSELQQALSAILHAVGSGGANSISAFADGTAPLLDGKPVNLDLVDAALASSGIAAEVQKLADDLASFRAQSILPSSVCDFPSRDRLIACTMQYQAWIERIFRDDVTEFMEDAGTVLGIVAIVIPEVGIPAAIVEIVNILIVKLYPTTLPSKITSLQVALARPVLVPSAWTQAAFQMTVSNVPGTIGLADIRKLFIATLEIATPEEEMVKYLPEGTGSVTTQIVNGLVNKMADIFKRSADWVVKRLYDQAYQKIWANDRITIHLWKIGPFRVDPQHPELLELRSKDPSVVSSIAKTHQVLDWGAHNEGTTTVQAAPRSPDTATQLFKQPFSVKKVGSFGNATKVSNQPTVVVVSGKIDYDVGNHGSHTAEGSSDSGPPAPGGGVAPVATGPNQVYAFMWQKAWALGGEGGDKSFLEFTCNTTPFSQLKTSIPLGDGQTPCNAQWYDDWDNPNYLGVTSSGVLSFDTCRVLSSLQGEPAKVLFTGSYGGTFKVQSLSTGKSESDSFTGAFTGVFDVGTVYKTDAAVIQAIEDQCDNWPVSP